MGLDMYLNAKRTLYNSVWNRDVEDIQNSEEVKKNKEIRSLFPEMFETDNLNYVCVSFEVGYWRKANHIHNWFVKNVQNGEDDCGDYFVSREDLERLRLICKKILTLKPKLKKKKQKIKIGYINGKENFKEIEVYSINKEIKQELPTKDGFFFGGTQYDEYYFKDIKKTIEIIDKCLELPECWDFEYYSSW